MRVILLFGGIMLYANVIMNIKVKERAALASGSADNQVIEADSLRDDEILFDIHQAACGRSSAHQGHWLSHLKSIQVGMSESKRCSGTMRVQDPHAHEPPPLQMPATHADVEQSQQGC